MKRLIVVLLAIGLAGCSSIPTAGPVVPVTASPNLPTSRGADIAPGPPVPGASPDQLVAGFLVAMAAAQPGFNVARKYLTTEANRAWAPESAGAQIYDADRNPPITTADSASIDAPLFGQLDAAGHFTSAQGRVKHDFVLVKVGDQWRISNPPKGLLISHYMFGRYFQAYPIYFFNAHQSLVPELVHLPSGQVTPETVLLALLSGPSSWLRPAVTTAVPAGTTLLKASIDDKRVAQVDFGSQIERLNDDERRRFGAQIVWTLTSFPRVTAVNVTMAGQSYAIPGQSAIGELELANQQGFQVLSGAQTSDLFAISQGIAGKLSDAAAFAPLPGAWGQPGANIAELALSMDGTSVAAVDTTRTKLMVGSTEGAVRLVTTGLSELSGPQIVLGHVWVRGRQPDGTPALIRVDSAGNIVRAVLDTGGARLVNFSMGPAGARVAAIVESGGRSELAIGQIEDDDRTLRVSGFQVLRPIVDGQRLTEFSAVGWGGEAALVALATSTPGGGHLAYSVSVDGTNSASLGLIGDHHLTSLSVLPRKSGLAVVVLASDGRIWRYDARLRWQRLAVSGITSIRYAG